MSSILPTVRYLIVCENVQVDPERSRRITLAGLLSAIRSIDDPPYPLLYEEFCVFLQLTECRGTGHARIEIHQEDTGQTIFRSQTREVSFGNDPLGIKGIVFRVRDCSFPVAGLYRVEFWYNNNMIAQHPLLLR